MAGCRSRALPRGEAAKARQEIEPSAGGRHCSEYGASTAAGPGAKPLIAWGRQGPPAAPSAGPAKPTHTWSSSWPASARTAPVPARASPSTLPCKLREPAPALASPERGSHSAAVG
ncbi:uncharacterized protein LOC107970121 isoform X1 [Pan troglodytes]|uniref:uncharacterized protein LOC107970121 isoform X1 n=1 Tax=Pan troglodytes TaxID=9598 RepID=UPI003013BF0D